jgi:hypothetical protein
MTTVPDGVTTVIVVEDKEWRNGQFTKARGAVHRAPPC